LSLLLSESRSMIIGSSGTVYGKKLATYYARIP